MGPLFGGNALLALLSAAFWGVGDFAGGMGVKRAGGSAASALRVILLSHGASLGVLMLLATTRGGPFPHGRLLLWGLLAGVAGGLALCCFYIALSRGVMGASAAVSGLLAAAIPACVAILADGAPGWRKACGFAVAALAIWMIAGGEAPETDRSTAWLAVAAGGGFGLYFVALKYAGPAGVLWPMATARMGSIATCGLLLAGSVALRPHRDRGTSFDRRVVAWALGTALFDTSGNLLFVAATRAGRLDVAAVLGSLYPASTILLAAGLLRERPTRRQGWGMAVAVAAVVLIAG